MTPRLLLPINEFLPSAPFYRVHLSHRQNAVDLAVNLIQKAASIEKAQAEADDLLAAEFGDVGQKWAVYTLVQGCYVREYHEWERAVKKYVSSQRSWNGLIDAYHWKGGGKNFVEHAICALSIFSVSIDNSIITSIDGMRRMVNSIKHDPLDYDVEYADYLQSVKSFEAFWDYLTRLEVPAPVNLTVAPS